MIWDFRGVPTLFKKLSLRSKSCPYTPYTSIFPVYQIGANVPTFHFPYINFPKIDAIFPTSSFLGTFFLNFLTSFSKISKMYQISGLKNTFFLNIFGNTTFKFFKNVPNFRPKNHFFLNFWEYHLQPTPTYTRLPPLQQKG